MSTRIAAIVIDEGYPVAEVMNGLASGEGDFDPTYLSNYIASAVTVYCPEYL